MSKYLINDEANEQVVIAFENSSNELEYSVFKLLDGGIDREIEDDIQEALALLLLDLGITDAEVQKIND